MSQNGMLLIISGPSGVGKTTITHHVEKALGGVFSVSMTTRAMTAADKEGDDYYFVDVPTFLKSRDNGELLEWAKVFDNYYGTPRIPVEQAMSAGKLVILEIDVQGAIDVKKNMPDAFSLFVLPPSEEELLGRLRRRQREDESTIQRRFAKAKQEIAEARECNIYDEFLVNDNLDHAVNQAVQIVSDELSRRRSPQTSGVKEGDRS